MRAMEPSSGREGGARMPMTPSGFDHGGSDHALRRVVDGAVIFVGPAGEGEEAFDGGGDFLGRARLSPVCAVMRAANSSRAVFEVFGEEIEDLRAVVGRGRGPAEGGAGGFDGVADVLAVALADFADELAVRAVDGAGVAAVRARLLAADIHLGGLVDRRRGRRAGCGLWLEPTWAAATQA